MAIRSTVRLTGASPAPCLGTKQKALIGAPNMKDVSTSYVERQNLNIRTGLRRFTRLTNAFPKKMENHCHALAIYFMHSNFSRIPSNDARCAGHGLGRDKQALGYDGHCSHDRSL